ncbi:phosphoglycerate mutase-like protein [Teratosphaeria nubilosa]|uniref:Phosphoglycerate mutase-like protein n=1 Tax=Teratosphaeria nubilosa TaxID=161662 RepID=A0A6G1L498_9PEZI|nr:phosphoglycerate mutase-like protein [Teratosphaeria nubilosa]
MGSTLPTTFKYESVPAFFIQDDPATDPETYDFRKHNFGLIDRSYDSDSPDDVKLTQWERFNQYLNHLSATSPAGVKYKLFYAGRHGQGDHNVAESFYGTKAWDAYWSKLEGNGTVVWADAHLTDVGEEQAREAAAFLGEQFAWAKMPMPQRYYVSPLYRCLQTARLTYAGLESRPDRPFKPVIREMLREVMGEHTCDRRSRRSFLETEFPRWEFEEGFTEADELWLPDHRETHEEIDGRTRRALDGIFGEEGDEAVVVVSTTTHSGQIASLLRVVGHRVFGLPTGGMIPVLVKGTRVG